ncbi:lacritin [Rhinolophus ferrumequinum]|uniref:Lacritin n=1 Tax=Rhinolophus ferrumequinum TaxID=59479 RepID=A0A7J7WQH6_RHIFE|nr:extracellular glycoprotein lacritin [Rhinolophus ferrumequinum]KAF6339643.1 lacritin [Rhinolophus ferrumequinum]
MRFLAFLLLAALAGSLVCAQDATSEPTETAPDEDPTSPELESPTTEESSSPQETDPEAHGTSAADQWVNRVLSPIPVLNVLKAALDRSFLLARKAAETAERRVKERIQGGFDYLTREA